MIVPIVDEARWLERLAGLRGWDPPMTETLVIAPHPDDETLSAGGLISFLRSRRVTVTVAAVTDGERAYADGVDLRRTRELEQSAALGCLGLEEGSIKRFRLPDSDVAACEERLVELLRPLVSHTTHIVAPWQGDFHPDHEACGRAAARVSKESGATLTYYFFWTWHRGTVELLDGLDLMSFAMGAEEQEAKRKALLCHTSQLHHASGESILPEPLLGPARRPFEVYLPS